MTPKRGVKLPRHVEIQWPPAGLNLSLDLGDVLVNKLTADPQQLFTKPTYGGYTEIDLAQPQNLVPTPPQAAGTGARLRPAPSVRYQ